MSARIVPVVAAAATVAQKLREAGCAVRWAAVCVHQAEHQYVTALLTGDVCLINDSAELLADARAFYRDAWCERAEWT